MDIEKSIGDDATIRSDKIVALGRIDQYELIRELGGGGFGCVYLAKDTVAGIDVAVKGLPPEMKHNMEELENIRANFALVSRLHHPNIAAALVLHPVVKAEYADSSAQEKLRVFERDTLMVMEYAPGVTLSQWRKQFPEKKVPLEKALDIVRQIAVALDYAHGEKIIHRDVKPSNVMIETKDDGSIAARILDFGLAAELRSSMGRLSREIRDTSGTRPYMAPEQWQGARQGPATDQYALAAMFYELVTGTLPFASAFEGGDVDVMKSAVLSQAVDFDGSIPRSVQRAVKKALAKNPDERFESCQSFVRALEGDFPDVLVFARQIGRRHRRTITAGICVLLLVSLVCLLWPKGDPVPTESQKRLHEYVAAMGPVNSMNKEVSVLRAKVRKYISAGAFNGADREYVDAEAQIDTFVTWSAGKSPKELIEGLTKIRDMYLHLVERCEGSSDQTVSEYGKCVPTSTFRNRDLESATLEFESLSDGNLKSALTGYLRRAWNESGKKNSPNSTEFKTDVARRVAKELDRAIGQVQDYKKQRMMEYEAKVRDYSDQLKKEVKTTSLHEGYMDRYKSHLKDSMMSSLGERYDLAMMFYDIVRRVELEICVQYAAGRRDEGLSVFSSARDAFEAKGFAFYRSNELMTTKENAIKILKASAKRDSGSN